MQKAVSLKRTLVITAIGLLGLFLNLGIIFYFVDRNPNFTWIQLTCVAIGTFAVSIGIQYVLINLAKKNMPLHK